MKKDLTTIKLAFRNNLAIFIVKSIAAFFTCSAGMIAEAIHSLADSGNQLLLLLGAKRSSVKADVHHPFGHGKEEYFWSFIVAMLLFVLGSVYSIYEGIHKIQHPEPLQYIPLSIIILLVGFGLEFQSWRQARKELGNPAFSEMIGEVSDSKDGDTVVVFTEDTAAIFGLLFAMLGIVASWITGNPIYDAIASVVIGVLLFVMATFLANEMRQLLVGESIDDVERRYVRRVISTHPDVKAVGKIRSMQLGSTSCIIAVDVDFREDLHDRELEVIMSDLKAKIRATIPEAEYIYIQLQKVQKEQK